MQVPYLERASQSLPYPLGQMLLIPHLPLPTLLPLRLRQRLSLRLLRRSWRRRNLPPRLSGY
jgi:hypothetical protein